MDHKQAELMPDHFDGELLTLFEFAMNVQFELPSGQEKAN
jgi:hypothetical protein